jgi:ATP-dependent exoDNAse (exonuclease V) beta subunit
VSKAADPATLDELAQSDARARETALDVGRSFIVQAPAGSGKTTVLTQRYLRLLTTVDEPEQVLAITFTRKAAGEMRERVQKALDGLLNARSDADRVTLELAAQVKRHAADRSWGLQESAARLRIQTIDAFNAYLANAMPITSRTGFGRGIADAPDDLYANAARETLRDAENDPQLRAPFELVMRRLDDNWSLLERLIAGMLSRRAEWLPNLPQLSGEALAPRIEASLRHIVLEELTVATGALPLDFVALASEAMRMSVRHKPADEGDRAHWSDYQALPAARIEDLPRWRALRNLSLTDKGLPRSRFTSKEGFPADDPDAKALGNDFKERLAQLGARHIRALESLGILPDPEIPAPARGALDALAQLLVMAAAQLTRIFNEQGECDHPEVAGAARRALTEDSVPTPLAERLGTRISHILVDEFQDTSRDQYELLLTLTQDWSDGDGRTLFLVGDPMQSIYGFRNAEVGRFATVRAGGLGRVRLQPLELRRNFRSAPALVHWCNDMFAQVFPPADDVRRSAVKHLASVAARAQLEGTPKLYRVDARCGPRGEAESAAELIAELKRSRPEESIAVLGGARTHLRAIRAALAARDVPYIGVNLEPLADVAAVRDLEALARALESPLDRVAWLAVLRAPFVGLALRDLTLIAQAAHATIPAALGAAIPGLSPDAMERLIRAKPVLLAAWQQRELEPRAHLVERVWLTLGGPSACAKAGELDSARRFLLALDEEDRKRLRGRPLDFERLMYRLYAQEPAADGAVQLMTIHGAKGLEFDHVFVLGVGLVGRGDDTRLLNWLELPRPDGSDDLLMAPIRVRDGDDSEQDSINRFIEVLHKERARAERARLAYVALTRAKRGLHLYLHPRQQEADGEVAFSADARSLLHTLWKAIEGEIGSLPAIRDGDPGEAETRDPVPQTVTQTRQRLVRRFIAPAPPADVVARGELVPLATEEEEIEFSWVRQTARRVGTVVHEALEKFGHTSLPEVAELPRLRVRLESRLQALGVEGDAAREGAERALLALRATLTDARGRWLFDPAHRDAHSELELTGVRGGQIVNAIIDRTFVDAGGIRWVVDFKTSPHEGGNLDAFLDEEARRYEGQLRRYAHLARELGPEPVRAGLYYPLLSAWREVSVV